MAEQDNKLSAEELAELRRQLKKEAEKAKAKEPEEIVDEIIENDGEPTEEEDIEELKHVDVVISEDRMTAYAVLMTPKRSARYTIPEVVAELRANKVVLGIQTNAIMEMINLGMYEEEVEVAKGKPETPGTEGYYEYLIDMEKRTKPEIHEDGTVDYTVMNRLVNVNEGDKIAIYHPAIQGTKGFDVCGKELAPKFVRDLPPLRGKYVRKTDDNEFFATMSGKISRSDNNIEILNVYEINEDLDPTKGVLEFYGDIIINGNVEDGVVIRAGRNLTINGTVSSARIQAGGDVVLSNGIQGYEGGKITTRGNVYASFVEYATIEARGDVHANYLLNSTVKSDGIVYVEGTKGSVIGGYVHGLKGVELIDAGNITEPRNFIHAGFSVEEYRKFAKLKKKEEDLNAALAMAVAEMTGLLRIGKERGVTQAQKDRIFELNEQKDAANATLDQISIEKKELGEKIGKGANASIIARGTLYRNTTISIETAVLNILEEESYVRFLAKDNEVIRRPVPKMA